MNKDYSVDNWVLILIVYFADNLVEKLKWFIVADNLLAMFIIYYVGNVF